MAIHKDQTCPDCIAHQLTWHCIEPSQTGRNSQKHAKNAKTVFVLRCDLCGEALREVSGDTIADFLNSYMQKAKPVTKSFAQS